MHRLSTNAIRIVALLIGFAIGGSAPVSAQTAPTGPFTQAVVQVVFSDEQDSDHMTLATLDAAGKEMHDYFARLSYGKLDFQIRFIRVHLPDTLANLGAQPTPWFYNATDAAIAADANFFKGAQGIGILILNKYGGADTTYGGMQNWPNISQPIVSSLLHEYPLDPVHPPGPSQVVWGGWAHEFGHQIEVYGSVNQVLAGAWLGHPSGYSSGYDQMDSCYPCHDAGFAFIGAPLIGDPRTVFPKWLDASHVATVPKPVNMPVGQTFVLPPLSQKIDNPVVQVVHIPVDSKRAYLVQARQRVGNDALQARTPLGILSEGIQIVFIDQDAQFPMKECIRNPNAGCQSGDGINPNDWPFQLWTVGDVFQDPAQKIKVAIIGQVTGGYEVNVTREVPPTHPDLFVSPWLTPPGNTYETVDIWIDSSCNGYEDQGGALRYGRRADGTVIGNGDDPCANHANRLYAKIRNIGDTDSQPTTATFEVSSPLGVGVTGNWSAIGTAQVPAIPAGQSVEVFVLWTPQVNLTPQQIQDKHFKFHSCVQVHVAPSAGELVTSNNSAQENIFAFEAVAKDAKKKKPTYEMPVMSGSFTITNTFREEGATRTYLMRAHSHLPPGWSYEINHGQMTVELKVGETRAIPVVIKPADSAIGKIYELQVDAITQRMLHNPRNQQHPTHPSWYRAGGLILNAHTVLPSEISVAATQGVATIAALPILVKGRLTPARSGATVTIDYVGDENQLAAQQLKVKRDGSFATSLRPKFAVRSVRAIWQGDMSYASAVATTGIKAK